MDSKSSNLGTSSNRSFDNEFNWLNWANWMNWIIYKLDGFNEDTQNLFPKENLASNHHNESINQESKVGL